MSRGGKRERTAPAAASTPVVVAADPPLGTFVLREAIRAEHELRHTDAAALRITDRCLGEVIMSLPTAIEHADGALCQRLSDLLALLTR